jgi:hypothetical protein
VAGDWSITEDCICSSKEFGLFLTYPACLPCNLNKELFYRNVSCEIDKHRTTSSLSVRPTGQVRNRTTVPHVWPELHQLLFLCHRPCLLRKYVTRCDGAERDECEGDV